MKRRKEKIFKLRTTVVAAAALVLAGLTLGGRAYAQACSDCTCVGPAQQVLQHGDCTTRNNEDDQQRFTRSLIHRNFLDQETWLLSRWRNAILPHLMITADHFVGVAMYQAFTIGTQLDGLQELKSQRLINELNADAHRDYQPNVGMCVFGTGIRSLATAERRGNYTRFVLSQRSQDRQMGHRNALGADGMHYDLRSRLAQFKQIYCDTQQNMRQLDRFCGASAPAATRNADLNYSQVVDTPQTINIDFTDNGAASPDETNVFALANNLYGNSLLTRIAETGFDRESNRELVLDVRALVAKRSVAENSFYSIIGMKTPGSVDQNPNSTAPARMTSLETAEYMKIILAQLGVAPADMDQLIGRAPSYYAQMNVLTKQIYQRPEFYADLYDTPANIERKSVSMMAIQLMQNFDLWESYLRQEATLSIWLELDLRQYQNMVENRLARLNAAGSEAAQ